jgi:hypothetical protein
MNNPKQRQQWIIDKLKVNPNTGFSELFSIYFEKFSKSEVTFSKDWNKASMVFKEYQDAINKAKLEQSIESEKEAVKMGLKTKNDRLIELQKQYERLEKILEIGTTNTHTFSQGVLVSEVRDMNALEIAKINQTIKEIRAEISKIEGDYAPKQIEQRTTQILSNDPLNDTDDDSVTED